MASPARRLLDWVGMIWPITIQFIIIRLWENGSPRPEPELTKGSPRLAACMRTIWALADAGLLFLLFSPDD
jgi:hypothetical protein